MAILQQQLTEFVQISVLFTVSYQLCTVCTPICTYQFRDAWVNRLKHVQAQFSEKWTFFDQVRYSTLKRILFQYPWRRIRFFSINAHTCINPLSSSNESIFSPVSLEIRFLSTFESGKKESARAEKRQLYQHPLDGDTYHQVISTQNEEIC